MKRQTVLLACVLAAVTATAVAQIPAGGGIGVPSGGIPMPGQTNRPGTPGPTNGPDMPGADQTTIPQQPTVDDATLQRQVHEQLMSKPELANVQVSVKEGVVYLSGSVPSKSDRKQAHKFAQSVRGVLWIKDKITIDANAGAAAAASSSATGADNPSSPNPSNLKTKTNTGGASGTAPSSAAGSVDAAPNPATPVITNPGERAVGANDDKDKDDDPQGSSEEASELAPQIQRALRNEPTLANDNVQASVVGNDIILDGAAASGEEKQTADRIAASFAGNRRVVNHITVNARAGNGISETGPPQKP